MKMITKKMNSWNVELVTLLRTYSYTLGKRQNGFIHSKQINEINGIDKWQLKDRIGDLYKPDWSYLKPLEKRLYYLPIMEQQQKASIDNMKVWISKVVPKI